MVETRRGKTTRLALSVTEAQPNRSPFIRLPVEVRLIIYKYVWTPTVKPWDYDLVAQREGRPVSDHMKQIHALTTVCRHMRYEVIAEYFHRTQAHITYTPGRCEYCGKSDRCGYCGRSDMRVLASMWHLKGSSLFTEHLQHVRLNWLPVNDRDGWLAWDYVVDNARTRRVNFALPNVRNYTAGPFAMALVPPGSRERRAESRFLRQINTLNWLTSLKSLRTLEITFIDVMNPNSRNMVPFYNPWAWQKMMKLPKLDWVTLRHLYGRHKEWKIWGQRLADRKKVKDLVKDLLKDSPAKLKKERKPYRIDINVGAVSSEIGISASV
ncbi:hypothetical protein QBC45DRAFT_110362 [Copromyces sp. CBS 386.78]|nr:hypothetical protein QBC45DRAFT_110362 [Copromyces sp. CBS 386.78]